MRGATRSNSSSIFVYREVGQSALELPRALNKTHVNGLRCIRARKRKKDSDYRRVHRRTWVVSGSGGGTGRASAASCDGLMIILGIREAVGSEALSCAVCGRGRRGGRCNFAATARLWWYTQTPRGLWYMYEGTLSIFDLCPGGRRRLKLVLKYLRTRPFW